MPYTPDAHALAGRVVLGDNLRRLRAKSGLTQEALALKAGMDRSFLADLESARHSCAVDRLFDLAEALGVDASTLLERPGDDGCG